MSKTSSWTLIVICVMMIGVFFVQGCASRKEITSKTLYESIERANNFKGIR